MPTLVLWRMHDTAFILPENLEVLPPYVTNLTTTEFPGNTHWIRHGVPQRIAQEIRTYVAGRKISEEE